MDAKYRIDDPDNVMMEMSVRMSLAEWRKFADQIDTMGYPGHKFRSKIRDMIDHAEIELHAEKE